MSGKREDLRWFNVPSTQVEFDDRDKSFHRIVYFGHGEKCLWVCHEAMLGQLAFFLIKSCFSAASLSTYFVILSNMLLGSRIKVGRTTLLKSAPGLNCEMMCESTILPIDQQKILIVLLLFLTISLIRFHHSRLVLFSI